MKSWLKGALIGAKYGIIIDIILLVIFIGLVFMPGSGFEYYWPIVYLPLAIIVLVISIIYKSIKQATKSK